MSCEHHYDQRSSLLKIPPRVFFLYTETLTIYSIFDFLIALLRKAHHTDFEMYYIIVFIKGFVCFAE